jgi:hypothetical protein
MKSYGRSGENDRVPQNQRKLRLLDEPTEVINSSEDWMGYYEIVVPQADVKHPTNGIEHHEGEGDYSRPGQQVGEAATAEITEDSAYAVRYGCHGEVVFERPLLTHVLVEQIF